MEGYGSVTLSLNLYLNLFPMLVRYGKGLVIITTQTNDPIRTDLTTVTGSSDIHPVRVIYRIIGKTPLIPTFCTSSSGSFIHWRFGGLMYVTYTIIFLQNYHILTSLSVHNNFIVVSGSRCSYNRLYSSFKTSTSQSSEQPYSFRPHKESLTFRIV